MGTFRNEEFGVYTRYAYTGCEATVVLTVDGVKKLVIGGKEKEATKEIYEKLKKKVIWR